MSDMEFTKLTYNQYVEQVERPFNQRIARICRAYGLEPDRCYPELKYWPDYYTALSGDSYMIAQDKLDESTKDLIARIEAGSFSWSYYSLQHKYKKLRRRVHQLNGGMR